MLLAATSDLGVGVLFPFDQCDCDDCEYNMGIIGVKTRLQKQNVKVIVTNIAGLTNVIFDRLMYF
jgi:hypothetical protein